MANPLLNISKPVSKQKFSEVTRSAGIADDFAVRKVISTREGTIERVPVNSNDIVNKSYVDSLYLLSKSEYTGANCGGLDGESNRTLAIGITEPLMIFVNNSFLHLNTDYTIDGITVTFLNALWNDQAITVVGGGLIKAELIKSEYTGSDCSGLDGESNRTLDGGFESLMVFVSGAFLHLNTDYTIAGTTITFLNALWNDQVITLLWLRL